MTQPPPQASENKQAGIRRRDFLFQPENFNLWLEAAAGFNFGPQRDFARHPVFSRDPKIAIYPTQLDFGRPYGWPARPGPAIGEIDVTYVLPDMVAKVVTGSSINEAMTWCEEQLNKIMKSKRTWRNRLQAARARWWRVPVR
jgi:hypothetical protein